MTINTLSFIDKLQWKGKINLNDGYDYEYSYKETDLHGENPRGLGIGMQIPYDAGFYLYHKYPEKFKGIFKEVKERKDKKGGELVRLKDYYDFYPIFPSLINEGSESWDYDNINFMDYFKIPVMDDEYLTLYNDKGMYYFERFGLEEDISRYNLNSQSLSIGPYTYFTFNTYRKDGKMVDTSYIKDGYGIYKAKTVYYSSIGDSTEGENSGIEMIFPIDPKASLLKLTKTEDEKSLVLFTGEGNGTYLYLIDLENNELLQRLFVTDKVISSSLIAKLKDIYLFKEDKERSSLLVMGEDGLYKLEGVFPVESSSPLDGGIAYKDGLLAFIKYEKENWKDEGESPIRNDIYSRLIIANRDEVLYEGKLKTDIDKLNDFKRYHSNILYELEWRD